ncbi:histidine kinase dimerization/phosphoacceptor domain -containing protein [Flavobacterium buctense]|uniref:histidine kinase n=1 Tax=Flavobacterium buctense TaxID=1648146 RepID=A0ABU9DZK3_9FLAO|nr:histidine kinase dimerization/phosphoacceptor domain -containing protein [Flavobacterium buctense]
MKSLILFLFLLFSQLQFSQAKHKLSAKEALILSAKYKEKASWFTDMPQYNNDSTAFYSAKAIKVLNRNEPTHRNTLLQLQLEMNKSKFYALSNAEKDSILNTQWTDYQELDPKAKENRILQYKYLVFWANIKLQKGDSKASLDLFEKALALIRKNDAPNVKARAILDKGLYYGLYGLEAEKKLSLKYLKESLVFYKKNYKKYPSEYYMINAELQYYYTSKNIDSAYFYLNEVKTILKDFKKPLCHIWYYSSLGSYLIGEKQNYEEGRTNINKTIELIEAYHFEDYYGYCLERLADIDYYTENYDQAVVNYSKAREVYLKNNDHFAAVNALNNIADTYETKGDLANALKFKKQYYTESLASQKELNDRSLRESELKVNVINQEKELIQKSNLQIFFIVALGLCAISLLLFYRNVRLKQRSNLKLAAVNHELEDKNELLDKRNAENELLLKEIHHRVKNNLEVVSSLLALQSAQIDDPNTKDAMAESQNRVNSIGIVHQKLYQGTNLGAIEMKDYFLNLSESILDSFGAEERVELNLAMEKLDLDIDTAVPLGLIINELLTNTIKYAFPKGEKGTVTIKMERKKGNILHLEVADNGVGKSGITHGTGFGGQLVSLLTNQLNGTMREDSQNGTAIIFDFKLKAA